MCGEEPVIPKYGTSFCDDCDEAVRNWVQANLSSVMRRMLPTLLQTDPVIQSVLQLSVKASPGPQGPAGPAGEPGEVPWDILMTMMRKLDVIELALKGPPPEVNAAVKDLKRMMNELTEPYF